MPSPESAIEIPQEIRDDFIKGIRGIAGFLDHVLPRDESGKIKPFETALLIATVAVGIILFLEREEQKNNASSIQKLPDSPQDINSQSESNLTILPSPTGPIIHQPDAPSPIPSQEEKDKAVAILSSPNQERRRTLLTRLQAYNDRITNPNGRLNTFLTRDWTTHDSRFGRRLLAIDKKGKEWSDRGDQILRDFQLKDSKHMTLEPLGNPFKGLWEKIKFWWADLLHDI